MRKCRKFQQCIHFTCSHVVWAGSFSYVILPVMNMFSPHNLSVDICGGAKCWQLLQSSLTVHSVLWSRTLTLRWRRSMFCSVQREDWASIPSVKGRDVPSKHVTDRKEAAGHFGLRINSEHNSIFMAVLDSLYSNQSGLNMPGFVVLVWLWYSSSYSDYLHSD